MPDTASVNISTRFTRKWVLRAYAFVASAFLLDDCPDFIVRLSGPQYRIEGGKWKRLEWKTERVTQ